MDWTPASAVVTSYLRFFERQTLYLASIINHFRLSHRTSASVSLQGTSKIPLFPRHSHIAIFLQRARSTIYVSMIDVARFLGQIPRIAVAAHAQDAPRADSVTQRRRFTTTACTVICDVARTKPIHRIDLPITCSHAPKICSTRARMRLSRRLRA